MPRFKKLSRWWTLILTLCLACAFAATISSRASAAGSRIGDETGGRNWSGNGGPPPPGDGDPDTPTPSSIKMARPIADSTPHGVGDVAKVDSVWMWHFRVVMQSLGLWSFGRF